MSTISSDRTRSIPQDFQDAQDRLSDVADQAQEKVQQAADQAQDRVRQQVAARTTQAGDQVNTHAQNLRSVADTLRERGETSAAELADRMADYGERAGGYLSSADLDTLLSDVERVASRQPGKVALGALAAGFAASRFLKASGGRRLQQRTRSAGQLDTGRTGVERTVGERSLYAGVEPYSGIDPSDPLANADRVSPRDPIATADPRGAIPGV